MAPSSKKAERGQWGWENPGGDQRDRPSCRKGRPVPSGNSKRAKDRPVSSPRQRLMEMRD